MTTKNLLPPNGPPLPSSLTPRQAREALEQALDRHKKGDIRGAGAVYRRVLELFPDHPVALHYLGLVAKQAGHPAEAERLLLRSIALDGSDPRTFNHLGQVLASVDRIDDAGRCFERALAVQPGHLDSLNNLANIAKRRADVHSAIALYRQVLERKPRCAHTAYNLANALKEAGQYDDALQWYAHALEAAPNDARAHYNRAILFEQLGRFESAVPHYLAALRIRPDYTGALANLLAFPTYQPDALMVERAYDSLEQADLDDEHRVKLHQGLGKHFDRGREWNRAFAHFNAANAALKRMQSPFRYDVVKRHFDNLIATYDREWFRRNSSGNGSERPVFIVGLPRSGTTLTEQILASHPDVFGAGELAEIPRIAREFHLTHAFDAAHAMRLADHYLDALGRTAPPGKARVTDKLPLNFIHLGLIATLFPRARIVFCRRHPMDVGLSCFMHLFRMEHDFTTDLEHFGRFFLLSEGLMRHWQSVLPMRVHELTYERLISDPQSSIRSLLEYCGLDWHPACLDFAATERAVLTPSRWQVRQPLYDASIGRWRHYAEHLKPLERVLEGAGFVCGALSPPELQGLA